MVEDPLNDFGPDPLFLIGLIDNDIPNSRTIHIVREDSAKAYQLVPIPGAHGDIGMPQHVFGIGKGPVFRPGSLMEQPEEMRRVEFSLV